MFRIFFAIFFVILFLGRGVSPAHATVFGIVPGDLIKLANDHNSATHEDEVVYYFDKDWERHPFPNLKVFQSWYTDFRGVKELALTEMAELRLAQNITYRPGTRLVKITSVPKVYAVEPGGTLRWIETEAVAKALYGADWAKRVDDVPESLFVNYHEGAPLTAPVYPTGTIVRRIPDGGLYFIDGLSKRIITSDVVTSLRVDERFVRTTSDLSVYDDGGAVIEGDWKYRDTSQLAYIDTKSSPLIDFPKTAGVAEKNSDQILASFRISTGAPLNVQRIAVTVTGPLWSGDRPAFTDLRFADARGPILFGTQQIAAKGAPSETFVFEGAYSLPATSLTMIDLRATLASWLPTGTTFVAMLDREKFSLVGGDDGGIAAIFYPRSAFSHFTTTIK